MSVVSGYKKNGLNEVVGSQTTDGGMNNVTNKINHWDIILAYSFA